MLGFRHYTGLACHMAGYTQVVPWPTQGPNLYIGAKVALRYKLCPLPLPPILSLPLSLSYFLFSPFQAPSACRYSVTCRSLGPTHYGTPQKSLSRCILTISAWISVKQPVTTRHDRQPSFLRIPTISVPTNQQGEVLRTLRPYPCPTCYPL